MDAFSLYYRDVGYLQLPFWEDEKVNDFSKEDFLISFDKNKETLENGEMAKVQLRMWNNENATDFMRFGTPSRRSPLSTFV